MRLSIINKHFSFSLVKRFSSLKRSLCLAGCFLGVVLSASAVEDGMKNDSIVHDTLIVNERVNSRAMTGEYLNTVSIGIC